MIKSRRVILPLVAAFLVVGCSSTPDDTYMYSDTTRPLEVPPDLVMPVANEDYSIPGIASQQQTYSGYSGKNKKEPLLPKAPKDVRLIRDGNLAWLEFKVEPDKLWQELHAFLVRIGYEIKREERMTGVMETNWIETRAAETGWFSDTLGEMDKYRIRLERGDKSGTTLVFVRHQGLSGSKQKVNNEEITVWTPRASDSEREAELLKKIMIFRGLNREQIEQLASANKQENNSRIITGQEGRAALEVNENFARTWRRVGLALDRMGLVIDDLNRSAGVYYIRVPDSDEKGVVKNLFSGIFGKKAGNVETQYLLSISDKGDKTQIEIRFRANAKMDNELAKKILTRIQAHIS
ncbi:MAG: outer membrane protein assembly factor BamC [Gammaproteobacteria bacterium]|nr:outer membrane protein assembly factor BamC [Gammaproteobacteria bacterium]